MKKVTTDDLRKLVNLATARLYSPHHKGLFRINAARVRGNQIIVLIDAMMDRPEAWDTERVTFEGWEFRDTVKTEFLDLVKERIDAAVEAMERRVEKAGRRFVPLDEVVGRAEAKG